MEPDRARNQFDHLSRRELIEFILKLQAECSKRSESTRDGSIGEDMILEIVGGEKRPVGDCYDIRSKNHTRLEVKYSVLTPPMSGYNSHRWHWTELLGRGKQKSYDRAILIGKKLGGTGTWQEHLGCDLNTSEMFVFFDIPFEDVLRLCGTRGEIYCNSSESGWSKIGRHLWTKCHVTLEELKHRYYHAEPRTTAGSTFETGEVSVVISS
jgi:hypothetical protein